MANSNQHRLQIPCFDPDKPDISAKAWINLVELGITAAGKNANNQPNWDSNIAASHVTLERVG